ncbi:hypothetical protein [Nonomuraea wenchangensis]|uniref:Uncharacterized protein n=1 Tax=Nonomuraea wenchangensis TaxID=568860 RepID=A0A1I0CL97_9ACTN|nr:hypothetical protein [Nonomuraea wenchangensis]SET20407.1 hypothetical protein SAMN05421811_102365 [Nonomuraea wenchangensis]
MPTTRSRAALAGGTANAARLFVAALAFTSAYVGLSAYGNARSAAAPVRTVTLSAREMPIARPLVAATPTSARAGAVTVTADGAAGCAPSYVARSLLTEAAPGQGALYRWRLSRWSPATGTWRTFLTEHGGFAAGERAVEWRPRISGNPGWYRVEVLAEGAAPARSDRFLVSC